MYIYIIGLIIVFIGLFLIYKNYSKISDFIIKNIIPNQNVIQIKQQMKELDEPKKEEPEFHFSKTINEILYIPIHFLYNLLITYGTPIVLHNQNLNR